MVNLLGNLKEEPKKTQGKFADLQIKREKKSSQAGEVSFKLGS